MSGFLFEDEISSHTTAGEVFDTFVIFSAISMCVEVTAGIIFVVFKQFDEEESTLEIYSTKTKILIIATKSLIVQVNMEQLSGFPSLGNRRTVAQMGSLGGWNWRLGSHDLLLVR